MAAASASQGNFVVASASATIGLSIVQVYGLFQKIEATTALGFGTTMLSLKADDGTVDQFPIPDAVYVPSSPCNLLSPQLMFPHLRNAGFELKRLEHDDDVMQVRNSS